MTREDWVKHIEESEQITRPTAGGSIEAWKEAIRRHAAGKCPTCIARARQARQQKAAKAKRQAYADLGMVRVRGALGGVYYE